MSDCYAQVFFLYGFFRYLFESEKQRRRGVLYLNNKGQLLKSNLILLELSTLYVSLNYVKQEKLRFHEIQ